MRTCLEPRICPVLTDSGFSVSFATVDKRELGVLGETLACEWLQRNGYRLIARNWRKGRLELDVIAGIGERVVFLEVKCRQSEHFGFPEAAVNAAKQRMVLKAAQVWCFENGWEGPVRFDIISVTLNRHGKKMLHLKDAFFPLGGI